MCGVNAGVRRIRVLINRAVFGLLNRKIEHRFEDVDDWVLSGNLTAPTISILRWQSFSQTAWIPLSLSK